MGEAASVFHYMPLSSQYMVFGVAAQKQHLVMVVILTYLKQLDFSSSAE